ncbi:MAG: hypothetical protein Q7U72_08000 [Brevundimonas sp.]|uniref:hypothetical protein n=1 Tax=Brevundimonas sp. TaxID=1871086 RepID=UPI00271EB906|nr:hypothetical protein [Brevundimonas sp.]MDO9077379.1 hypothetical protein [Brevundimonas sp.]MDP3080870.1 hypothetical protein [Brevundimonas sp.]MDZ4061724.1 hypothetical protein [Brevundimonas sp.]
MAKGLKSVFLWSAAGLAALIALVFVAAAVVGYFSAQGSVDEDRAIVWIMGAFVVLIMIGAMVAGAAWMRSIDEAAREAHKAAWYWGGSGGMAVGGVLLCMATLPQAGTIHIPSWLDGRTDPAAYAATGAFGMMMLMLIGYTVVWAWWWITRMRD